MSRQIFLCTPLHSHACPFYSFLLSTCTAHLGSAHPELAALQQTHGLTALEALVRRGRLITDITQRAETIFVCDFHGCRFYCLGLDDAVQHCSQTHTAYTDVVRAEFGSVGVEKMVSERMKCSIAMDDHHGRDEDHDDDQREDARDETDSEEEEEEDLPAPPPPGTILIGGTGTPLLAETVPQLADLLRRRIGPRLGGWARAMRDGKVKIHFDHRDGTSGICSVRTDERVAVLKGVMEFGVVRVEQEEEEEEVEEEGEEE